MNSIVIVIVQLLVLQVLQSAYATSHSQNLFYSKFYLSLPILY